MAYVAPTIDDFYARFPDLASGQDDELIETLLAEAARYVDTSWREADYAPAILYLAAHWKLQEASADSAGIVQSESFGPISVSYGKRSDSSAALASTQYGQRFIELRRGNFPPIMVI